MKRQYESPSMSHTITPAQIGYLKLLLNQAFANRYTVGLGLDVHHLDGCSKEYASAAIKKLVTAKANNWKDN